MGTPLRILLYPQASMRTAKIGKCHGVPTHLPVIAPHFGKGERLAHLPLVTLAADPLMPLHRPGVDVLVAQQVQFK